LFGVGPADPVGYTAAPSCGLAVLVACGLKAWRAGSSGRGAIGALHDAGRGDAQSGWWSKRWEQEILTLFKNTDVRG